LLERSRAFAKLGSTPEAYELVEAALLLDDNVDLRHAAVIARGRMADRTAYPKGVSHEAIRPEMIQRALPYYLRGIDHLEAMSLKVDNFRSYREEGGLTFLDYFVMHWGITGRPPQETRDALEWAKDQSAEAYLAIAWRKLKEGKGREIEWARRAASPYRDEKKYAFFLKVLDEWKAEPGHEARVRNFATHGYTPTILLQPAGQDFLAKLEQMDHPDSRRLAQSLRQQAERYAASRTKQEDTAKKALEARQAREAAELAAGPADVVFNEIKLTVEREGRPATPLKFSNAAKFIAAGPGIDAFSSNGTVYLMKKRDVLKPVFTAKDANTHIARVVFDGKYLWVPVTPWDGPARLIIIDPVKEQHYELTTEDGLPLDPGGTETNNHQQYVRVAPIGPGEAIVAGYFGRTWLAHVKLPPTDKPQVKVILEAREQSSNSDKEQWKRTDVAFQPAWMFTVTNPKDPTDRRVIVGRAASIHVGYHPLLVDLKDLKVSVIQDECLAASAASFDYHYGLEAFGASDAMWWCWPTRRMSGDLPKPNVFRVGFPDFKRELIASQVHTSDEAALKDRFFIYQGRAFVAARDWWVADTPVGPYRKLRGDDPERTDFIARIGTGETKKDVPDKETEEVEAICFTHHYGLVCIARRSKAGAFSYEVTFPGLKASATQPTPQKAP
jgi:hypothetical protein